MPILLVVQMGKKRRDFVLQNQEWVFVLRGVAMTRVVLVERNVVLMDVAMSVCIQLEVLSHHLPSVQKENHSLMFSADVVLHDRIVPKVIHVILTRQIDLLFVVPMIIAQNVMQEYRYQK